MSSGRVTVPLRPGSDGDATHVPRPGSHTQVIPPTLYLEKIADKWMNARGEAQAGKKYILQNLPAGYTMWQRPRPSDARMDSYLYGHPNRRPFDSPNRFYPHFEYMMDNAGNTMGCPCTVCCGASGILPRTNSTGSAARTRPASAVSSPHFSLPVPPSRVTEASRNEAAPPTAPSLLKGRPKTTSTGLDTTHVDEEGTPDVYRNLIDKLKRNTTLDELIEQTLSPDWRAEQELLPKLLEDIRNNEQWMPRSGDVVLFVRNLPAGVKFVRHEITSDIQLYDTRSGECFGVPLWEAGVVSQTSSQTTKVDLHDSGESETNVTQSGVRIEPFPGLNASDKSLSKRHKYVALRQTRPFILWSDLLDNIDETDWHPTVMNALTAASTLSLMVNYRFRGTWPNAIVYSHGIYIGFEMLAVGDTVRLIPGAKSEQTVCTDIMVIKSIRLKWTNLDKASSNDFDESEPYKSEIWIYGCAYTTDPARSDKQWLTDQNKLPPKAADEYGPWYPLHPASKELAIPCARILGRLHEREALSFFLTAPQTDPPSLDTGRQALQEARNYSRQHDQRICQNNVKWYWGNSRAEALDLHTVNGLQVADHDHERNLKNWRKQAKLLEAIDNGKIPAPLEQSTTRLGGNASRFSSFMAPATSTLPLRSPQGAELSGSSSISSSTGGPSGIGRKRSGTQVLKTEEAEDNEEIRRHTKIVEDDAQDKSKKRPKVLIVID